MHVKNILRNNRRRPKRTRSGRRLRFEPLEDRCLLNGDFGFVNTFGGLETPFDFDRGSAVTVDAAGSVYMTGAFRGTIDMDPGPGVVNLTSTALDAYVAKYESNGELVWATNLGRGQGRAITVDHQGSVYVGGASGSLFVFKLDNLGQTVWSRSFGDSSNAGAIEDIRVDIDGNVYTTGLFKATIDFDPGPSAINLVSNGGWDVFLSALDSNGDFVWAKSFGSDHRSDESGSGLVLDGDGNIYLTGHFNETADFDPGPGTFELTSAGHADVFLSKFDSSGNFIWAKHVGNEEPEFVHGIVMDDEGDVVLKGIFIGTVDFDPGPDVYEVTSAGVYDVFVSKFDRDGNFTWVRSFGGTANDSGGDKKGNIVVDDEGFFYMTGSFQGTADFDPSAGVVEIVSQGGTDVYVAKLDGEGGLVWVRSVGGADYDFGSNIAVDGSGNVYSVGFFRATADFDPGPGTQERTSTRDDDIFLLQLKDDVGFQCNTTVSHTLNSGPGSLRAAILCANQLEGVDTISFNIPGAEVHTIHLLSALPAVTDAVIIDATTQAGYVDTPVIELDGSLAGAGASGLTINRNAGGSTIRGLAINRFNAHGIFLSRSDGNHIEENFIGTDTTGTVDLGNRDAGVIVINGADNVVGGDAMSSEGNVISGNRRGVVISGRLASGNQISGNLIGVDASGTAELGNSHGGIEIIGAPNNVVGQSIPGSGGSNTISSNRVGVEIRSAAATGNLIINNKVGTNSSGTAAVANRIGVSIRNGASATSVIGNQISGNSNDGVRIVRADGNRIDANRIGEFLLGNGGDGVDIRGGQGNAIGGNLATASSAAAGPALDLAQGNRIEANAGFGVSVFGDGNSIQINTIGTQARVAERGNQRGGIQILKGSQNAVRENLISGNNGPGVLINGSDANANLVQGNTIGVKDLGGTSLSPLGNSVGVEIRNARDNLIGGSAPNEVNHISGNDKYGIQIHGSATGNHVQGNVIGLGTLSYFFPQLPGPGQPPPTSPLIVTVEVPNGRDGILVEADGNVIGGTAEGAGNVISGNGRNGVLLMGDGNRVQGNEIGTLLTGGTNGSITVAPLLPFTSNGADGVRVHGSNNIIGGSEAGAGNLIAFNAVSGVRVSGGIGNAVVQNSIFDNLGLGIDLGRMGPNENDGPLDADSGANNLQNTPEILRTQKTATHLQIIFYVPSQSPHSTYPIRAEFFVADDDGQEGRTFLSSTEVALPTPAVISIPLADLSPGSQIVATATDADGNTSEFSAPFAADQPSATTSAAAATDLVFQDFGE